MKAIEIDDEKLKDFLTMKPSLKETAFYFKCSEDTIERHVKKHHDMTFKEYRKIALAPYKYYLVRLALKKALNEERPNDDLHKFCLKNIAGWSEKVEQTGDKAPTVFTLNYSIDEATETKKEKDEGSQD